MWYEAIWFFSGVLLYSFFSKLLNVGTSVVFFRTVQAEALVYLGTAVESIAFINEIKYSAMKEAERPVEQIKAMRLVDDEIFSAWKQTAIARINGSLPPHLVRSMSLEDWQAMMKYLDASYKKGGEKV